MLEYPCTVLFDPDLRSFSTRKATRARSQPTRSSARKATAWALGMADLRDTVVRVTPYSLEVRNMQAALVANTGRIDEVMKGRMREASNAR